MKNNNLHITPSRLLKRIGAFQIFKKIFSLLIGIKLFTACTTELQTTLSFTEPQTTLSFVVPETEIPQWDLLIEKFQQRNPNIQIDLKKGEDTSDQLEERYISDFRKHNSELDLVYMDIIWVSRFANNDWIMNLSNLVSKQQRKQLEQNFLKNDLQGGYYDNNLYRIPLLSDISVLYYRKDLLKNIRKQPPETFEDLIKISKKLQTQGKVEEGYLWQGRQYEGTVTVFIEILKGYSGFWIKPDTNEVGLDRPEAIDAVKFLRSMIENKVSPRSVATDQEAETRSHFQNGRAAFLRHWPDIWTQVNAQNSDVYGKVGIQPMPGLHTKANSKACQGGWGLGIAKNTEHPDEAWKAIQFFTSATAQRQFALAGYMPSRRALLTDPQLVKKYSHYPVLLESIENSVLRPPIPKYAEASAILQEQLNKALQGKLSSRQAMKNAARKTRELLNNP